jgi:hypothetical protein
MKMPGMLLMPVVSVAISLRTTIRKYGNGKAF